MFAAIAVAVTCALCFGVQSKPVGVDDVETATPTTSTAYSNITGTGYKLTLKAGDTIDYTYAANTSRSILLPRGEYYLEVWGASGGKSQHATMTANTGGYTKAKYSILSTAGQTIWVVTGGQGAGSGRTPTGGYNGGGSGGKASSDSAGGGGATHFATAQGLLNSLNSNRTAVLVVAGGGGGNGCSNWNGGKGGGGSVAATAGTGGSSYKPGGAGATSSGIGAQGSVTNVTTKPTFGLGGSSSTSTSLYGCGGGGGGYWGGWPGNNISGGGASGGGGSGFCGNGATLVSGTAGTAPYGNGKARITVISVNNPPETLNYTIDSSAPKARSGSVSIAVAASSLASDKDYANISGGKATNVYFSRGLSGNNDTSWGTNAGIYLDAACSKIATPYINWKWNATSSATTLTITKILKLPRNGVDGATAANRLTLYTKIRDNYGTSTTRGVAVIRFYLQVKDNPITALPGVTTTNNIYRRSASYKVGLSTNSSEADRSLDYNISNNAIYNPKGNGRKTIFLPKPISPTDTTAYVINATDVYTDADTSYDKVAFKTATIDSANSKYYSLTFNTGSGYASGLYPSITLKATGARPVGAPYVTLTLTAKTSETASLAQIGSENNEVELVFRISNTRPYFASSALAAGKGLTEPYVELATGESKRVNLKSFLFDPDDGEVSKLTSTVATGAKDLKIPTNEYVQVDMSNTAVALLSNIGSNYYNRGGVAATTATSGEGTLATGFKTDLVAAYGSAGANDAQVLYRYIDSQTIEFIGRSATYNQYSTSGRLGHFYVMVRVIDPSDPSDGGIWYPIALKVNSNTPVEPTPYANFTLSFNNYSAGTGYNGPSSTGKDATASASESIILTPLSFLNSAGTLVGIGKENSEVNQNDRGHANPFVVDADAFMYTTASSDVYLCDNTLNDFVMLDGGDGAILDNDDTTTGTFFKVTTTKLYAARNVFARYTTEQLMAMGVTVESDGAQGYCSFLGLSVTPLRSTNGEYFQFRVKVKDSRGKQNTVSVCVKVENRGVSARRWAKSEDGTDYPINEMTNGKNVPYGEFKLNNSLGKYAVDYVIENNDTIQITPYDFAYDWDMDPNNRYINPKNSDGSFTYNSNPRDTDFLTTANYILNEYTIAHTTLAATSESDKTKGKVTAQQLTFANPDSIISSTAQYAGYIKTNVSSTTTVGGKTVNIPCIEITGVARTTSAIVQVRFAVTDGFSSVDCLVTITARNSAPVLNTEANHPHVAGESNTFRLSPYYSISASGIPNEQQFTATQIAYDKDGDTPTFVSGSAKIVAKDGDKYYEALSYNTATDKYSGVDIAETEEARYNQIILSDYAAATITKDGNGYDVVAIRALSSTELFDKPIYLQFQVQDGFRAQPQTATLYLPINIVNSEPEFVTDSLEKTEKSDTSGEKYTWMISFETATEINQPRYIANSKELYDSSALNVPESNKTYLFNDADAMQNVIVNPAVWAGSGVLVQKHNSDEGPITTEMLSTGGTYQNAAVVYTPMYSGFDDNYVKVTIEFFNRDYSGVFTPITSGTAYETAKQNCQYWAIKIVDEHKTGTPTAMQLALSVKDNHHNKYLYSVDPATSDKVLQTTQSYSQQQVVNFYYGYKQPGVRVMHTYYRTDGNAEAKTIVDEENGYYAVDYRGVSSDSYFADKTSALATEYKATSTTEARKQEILQSIEFSENFKYLYFERSYTTDGGSTALSYKHFADGGFKYDPIVVNNGNKGDKTIVPMSYIAMPKLITGSTENTDGKVNTHVTFANASHLSSSTNTNPGVGNVMFDDQYQTWSATDPKVFANLKLSDGVNEWSGSDLNSNPYITINYVANLNLNADESDYINGERFTINSDGKNTSSMSSYTYREDKYGFSFVKKNGGRRASGLLKLTVAVKTIDADKSSDIEYAEVEINLVNTKPQVKYYNKMSDGLVDNDLKVEMTMGMTEGKSIKLASKTEGELSSITATDTIAYHDSDVDDELVFYMPSATGNLTESEVDHVLDLSRNAAQAAATNALTAYYSAYKDYNTKEEIVADGPYDYDPNPGYEKFFDISPESGSSATLQFIPNAKTQPNISADELDTYLENNHLKKDASGNVYYPFRILFYDRYNNSPFTSGYWSTAIVKVYINNDPIDVNKAALSATDNMYKSTVSATSAYNNKYMYKLALSKNSSFFIDVSTLLSDNDIVLSANNTFVTNDDPVWIALPADEKVRKDYLVMPDAYGYVNLNDLAKGGDGSPSKDKDTSPVEIRQGDGTSMPKTTLIFLANSAFKTAMNIAYEFADSNGARVTLVFNISYNNDAPTPNTDTYSGSDVIDITMMTGDTFYVYASDSTKFDDDAKGGFPAYNGTTAGGLGVKGVKFPFGGTQQTAKQMSDSFGFYTATYGNADFKGNSLVLGSDDAASTLRIYSVSFTNRGDENYIKTATYGDKYVYDKNTSTSYDVCKSITAVGAINTILTVKLIDGSGALVDAKLRINVLSTAPYAKNTKLPSAIKYVEENVYSMELSYGESKSISLGSTANEIGLMADIDLRDIDGLYVYTNMDGSQFDLVNPTGVPVVSAEYTSARAIVITAVDFINDKAEVAEVKFRVSDAHGATSEIITIKVTIAPRAVTKASKTAYDINLMSYLEYSDLDGNANEDIIIPLVENADAKIFKDPDADAVSAEYDIAVYALLYQDDNGAINTTTYGSADFDADKALITRVYVDSVGNVTNISNYGVICEYVEEFYTVTISDNGKELHFVPNSVTIRSGKEAPIPMYAIAAKRYKNDGNTTMPQVEAEINVKVANSKLQAAESNAYNHGYPHADGETGRDSAFLEFSGTAGDSLTWNLYDLANYQHGLFYDYDMLNYDGTDGKETITYIDSSYEVAETGVRGKPAVLTVSSDGLGDKQTVTITINRKVYSGIPPVEGVDPESASTSIDVYIYATDTVNSNPRPSINDKDRVVAVKITVTVKNDDPTIAETVPVTKCPYCGSTENIKQENAHTASCGKCNKTFKSLDPVLLGYSITYSDIDGYVLEAKIENTKTLTLLISDIINDADIDMDSYVLLPSGYSDSLVSDGGEIATTVKGGDIPLFNVSVDSGGINSYGSPTLSSITFACISTERGKVATCSIMIRDSVQGSAHDKLNIRLTVDNIAPAARDDVSKTITMMGVSGSGKDEDAAKAAKTFSILDFITDANGDAYDPSLPENEKRTPHTYTYIDEIEMYGIGGGINEPVLFGPNLFGIMEDGDDAGKEYYLVETGCTITWADEYHQKFSITPYKGVFGEQTVRFTIYDSGYEDGASAGVSDLKSTTLTLKIMIANPLDDVPETLPTKEIVYGVTRTVTVVDLLGEDNATGYEIAEMEESGTQNLIIYKPGEAAVRGGVMTSAASEPSSEWRIYAYTEDSTANVKVTFRAGDVLVNRTLPVRVVRNNPPQLLKKSYTYTTKMLDDPAKRTIKIKPTDWFIDMDAEDVMTFITPVATSQKVKVEVDHYVDFFGDTSEAYLLLKFHRRGESVITVNVSDLSGRSYQYEITVNCTDAPEMSWWENFVSIIEAHWMWFWIILACILLFLILLILLIIIIHKKRKMRREIEALLESETELEEEMMRLSSQSAQYQSFGFLPPAAQTMRDPGLMLGGGAGAPAPNSLQLNAGTGAAPVGSAQPTNSTIPNAAPRTGNAQTPPAQGQTPPSSDGFDPDDF